MKRCSRIWETSGNTFVVKGINYVPLLSTILLTIHVGLLLVGIRGIVTEVASILLLVLLTILLSVRFNFCILHKLLILYMTIMTICVCIQRFNGFGVTLTSFRVLVFALGVVLSGLAIYKINEDGCYK